MIKEVYKDKEEQNLNYQRLRGRLRVSSVIVFYMLKKNKFQSIKELTKLRLTNKIKKA